MTYDTANDDPLTREIREVCRETPGDWRVEGVGNSLTENGYVIRVQPQGFPRAISIFVTAAPVDLGTAQAIPFVRQLHREGFIEEWEDGKHRQRDHDGDSRAWLKTAIAEAFGWVAARVGDEVEEPDPEPEEPTRRGARALW